MSQLPRNVLAKYGDAAAHPRRGRGPGGTAAVRIVDDDFDGRAATQGGQKDLLDFDEDAPVALLDPEAATRAAAAEEARFLKEADIAAAGDFAGSVVTSKAGAKSSWEAIEAQPAAETRSGEIANSSSPPRRPRERPAAAAAAVSDSSPPRRRPRPAGDDESAVAAAVGVRLDSSAAAGAVLRQGQGQGQGGASPPRRRRRFDSDDGGDPASGTAAEGSRSGLRATSAAGAAAAGRGVATSSAAASVPPASGGHTSAAAAPGRTASPPRRPPAAAPAASASAPRRRYDSDDEDEPASGMGAAGPRGGAGASAAGGAGAGAAAGSAGAAGGGGGARPQGTVYRDKSGAVVDVDAEMARLAAQRAGDAAASQAQAFDVRVGAAQKRAALEKAAELAKAAAAPLARYVDDADLEASRRAVMRDGDPMAAFLAASVSGISSHGSGAGGSAAGAAGGAGASATGKPRYKGPPAPPNRFGIAPGYRWDGVVRGTGFEAKILATATKRAARADTKYVERMSDM